MRCRAKVEVVGKTGGEMEVLAAVQVWMLIIYGMCKAVDRGMVMLAILLLEKHGRKSGNWLARV